MQSFKAKLYFVEYGVNQAVAMRLLLGQPEWEHRCAQRNRYRCLERLG